MSFKIEQKESIAFLYINTPNSQVNLVDKETLDQIPAIEEDLKSLGNNQNVHYIIVFSTKPGSFMTSVDFNLLMENSSSSLAISKIAKVLQKFTKLLANFSKPIIAIINGECSSFGLELALACKYRIAVNSEKSTFGFPDIEWGLIPAAGGCLRLTNILPVSVALDLLLNKRRVDFVEAYRIGLVGKIIGQERQDNVILKTLNITDADVATWMMAMKLNRKKCNLVFGIYQKISNFFSFKQNIFQLTREEVYEKCHSLYPAPMAILELTKHALLVHRDDSDETLAYDLAERWGYGELASCNQNRNLLVLQMVKFNRWLQCCAPSGPKKYVIVVGNSLPLKVFDRGTRKEADTFGYYPSPNLSSERFNNGYYVVDQATLCTDSKAEIQSSTDTELVIDGAYENVNVNKRFQQVTRLYGNDVLYAVVIAYDRPFHYDDIGQENRDKVVCLRSFNFVNNVYVLEIVASSDTLPSTILKLKEIGSQFNNVVVVTKNSPSGFVLRVLMRMVLEALELVLEGLSPWKLDRWMNKFGYEAGIFSMMDKIGVDVVQRELVNFGNLFGERFSGAKALPFLKKMIANGFLGRQSTVGFYEKDGSPNMKLKMIINDHATVKEIDANEAQWRMTCRFIDETMRCLADGIIDTPLEGDVAAVYALGFPPVWGGPFRLTDIQGAATILKKHEEFNWNACATLVDRAANGNTYFPKSLTEIKF